jgi:tRNA (cmo5U34)-methyltransferase
MSETEQFWKTPEAAEHFAKIADVLIPGRQEILSRITALVTMGEEEPLRVLDLGCGFGDVTAAILKLRPNAQVCMVDFSDEMLRLSKERFIGNPRISFIKHDLNGGLPTELERHSFSAVVSCFALHHVEFACRVNLYHQIKELLVENGLFLNGDRFREASPVMDESVFQNWAAFMAVQLHKHFGKEETVASVAQGQRASDQRKGDKPGTIWEMARDLQQAGFRYADCIWKQDTVAIMVAANQ